MPVESIPRMNSTITIRKEGLNDLLLILQGDGYTTIGPKIEQATQVYGPVASLNDLPLGYFSEQKPGSYRLVKQGHSRYFDAIPGAHSWKQFLFPPRVDLFQAFKENGNWITNTPPDVVPKYAFIGVRGCELSAIQMHDRIFMRPDFTDPVYARRRENIFILAVNCTRPADTCFCTSFGTGPEVRSGFDLCLTELDQVFLVTIGSEAGQKVASRIAYEEAFDAQIESAALKLKLATTRIQKKLDTEALPERLLDRLESPHWRTIATRCLSCANCTQVCPTCFCWDVMDTTALSGEKTSRTRVWDSCFNPGFSYQAGGNTRPTIYSRYRQWLSHKFGTWKEQYGAIGCVGCGRCITWCPAGIDIVEEISTFLKERTR